MKKELRIGWEYVISVLMGVIIIIVMLPCLPALLIEWAEGKVRLI